MIGALVVTHGDVAKELVGAAERILGDGRNMRAVCIGWDEDVGTARRRIVDAIEAVEGGAGVIIMTDMFGGTASNLSLTLMVPGRVEVVTGVNLTMLLKLGNAAASGMGLAEIAEAVCARGRESIQIPSRTLRQRPEPRERGGESGR